MIKLELSTEPRFFVIDIPVYETELIVLSRGETPDMRKYLESILAEKYIDRIPSLFEVLEEKECDLQYDACFLHNEALNLMILTSEIGEEPTDLIPIISHEALHATIRILDTRGIQMSNDSEEAYTYLQQYIIKEILKGLKIEEQPLVKKDNTHKWWERSK